MHKKLLADKVNVKNSDIWARYIYWKAFGIVDKDLGSDWTAFSTDKKR